MKKYYTDIQKISVLSSEEEKKLFLEYKEGSHKARNKLIHHNLRLVLKAVIKYKNAGISFDDLVQAGNIGLIIAVEGFDLSKKNKFSTYAFPWITGELKNLFKREKGKGIKYSDDILKKQQKIKKIIKTFETNSKEKPTIEEIAENSDYDINEINKIQSYQSDVYSYNEINEQDIPEHIHPKQNHENLEKEGLRHFFSKKRAIAFLDHLSEKERIIINLRFGLFDGKTHSLQQIADKLGVSRPAIHKAEKKLIKKVRGFTKKTTTKS